MEDEYELEALSDEDSQDDVPLTDLIPKMKEQLIPKITSKWMAPTAKVEIQGCDPHSCDSCCTVCDWEPCQVTAPCAHSCLSSLI